MESANLIICGIGLTRQQHEDFVEYAERSTFVCLKCGKNYARKASLQRHLQSTLCGTLSMFFCNYCRYRTNHTVTWNVRDDVNNYDSTTYHVHKRYVCPFCKKVYGPKNLLKKHMQLGCKMNPRNTQFACTFCPYKSTYKANMERHVRNVHNTGGLKFRCELCNFRSNYSFCVRRHIRTFHRAIADESKQ